MRSAVLLVCFSATAASAADRSQAVTFNRDVRPILSGHCFACHGFDANKREADLRLDTFEGATADRDGTFAIKPGDPENSEVWTRITAEDESVMPPEEFHKPLTAEQKNTIRRWIEQGAVYEKHWSFIPPQKPAAPKVEGADNPIDSFVQHRLQAEGLRPNELATKTELIRRVTLDLTGLPPTVAEVDAFLNDESPDAYDKLVDELQSRTSYGEHMARYWLDLARYADTHGLHLDNERSMWPYRDWVVKAINDNVPFDDFTRWQLAGDLLPEPTTEQLVASGFNRCNVTTSEGGSINEEWIYRYAVDRTSTTVEVWMGLTGGCAVCHDHKFDPLSTKEFYSLYAFFHSAADPAMDGNKIDTPPILKLTPPEDQAMLSKLKQEIASLDKSINDAIGSFDYSDPADADPRPEPRTTKQVWFDDGFPAGVKVDSSGAPLKISGKDDGPVFSGELALRRTAAGLEQDYFAKGANFTIPAGGKFYVHCFLDESQPPETIMVQFHTKSWSNRVVWGAADKIPFGRPNTTEKVDMGPLPEAGKWVRLEFTADKAGLKPGTKVTGFAFTQFAGTVSWDDFGLATTVAPASDPRWSWKIWKKDFASRRKELPDALKRELQGKKPDTWTDDQTDRVYRHWMKNTYAGAHDLLNPFIAKQTKLQQEMAAIEKAAPITMVMADLAKPRESFVMLRGAYDAPGEKVSRNVPAFLPPLHDRPSDRDYNRLDLANWLVSGNHPLTARVTVNRIWQQFFGTGLVETSEDFGSQGLLPSHPQLLDWLATQFVDDGWDMKQLVKRIVTSHAYRQSTKATPELIARDPNNRLIARGPRMRLDAEVLRDQALFIGGLMVDKVGGPGVKPYQPPNIWEPVAFGGSNTRFYKQDSGDSLYRRSLYTFLKRTAPPPFMTSFDAPNREQACSRRGRSNTPLQALQLMNDVQHVEAARGFAERMFEEGGATPEERIRWAWRSATSRQPTDEEVSVVLHGFSEHLKRFEADEKAAQELIAYGESSPAESLPADELAAWTLVANLILNLDETVCKN